MVFDYHVHVTGAPVYSYKNIIKSKLKASLIDNNITGFIGVVASSPPMSKSKDMIISSFNAKFDSNNEGLKIVRELGGEPAVLAMATYLLIDNKALKKMLKWSYNNGVRVLKLYTDDHVDYSSIIKEAEQYCFDKILAHTPEDLSVIEPLFEQARDTQLILGHGCINSKSLMKLVKDSGALVDTSQQSIDNIKAWVDAGLEDQLVFGSDWPCPERVGLGVDWGAQKRELVKLSSLGLQESFYNKRL